MKTSAQSFATAPVLETDRLILRSHRREDFPDCAAMWACPTVTRFLGGLVSTPSQTWTRLLRYVGHWSIVGFGYWALEEKASGRFIGELGFADFKRDIQPSIEGIPEAGWVLISDAHGKGYASEGLAAALAWADNFLTTTRTVCIIDPANLPSIRLAEKLAYHERVDSSYDGRPTAIFYRDRPEKSI